MPETPIHVTIDFTQANAAIAKAHQSISEAKLRHQVSRALAFRDGGADLAGIVGEIVATHGLISIDYLGDEFWAIVARHDTTQA